MKKILYLITISTLTTIIPTPLLSNISLIESSKQDVGINNSNNEYVPLKEISGFGEYKILSLKFSKNNDLYFGIYADGAYKMTAGSDSPTKINGISGTIRSIFIDKYDNIYFAGKGAYKMTAGSDSPTKINGINENVNSINLDKENNIYFGTENGVYVLKNGSDTPTKINGINDEVYSVISDLENNIYFSLINSFWKMTAGSDTPTQYLTIKDKYLKFPIIDKENNIYFGTEKGAYKMTAGSDSPTKINGINENVNSINLDKENNTYFGTENGVYVLKNGSDTPTKINAVGDSILSTVIDNSNNLYFVKKNGLYTLQTALSWTKEQSQFNLIDSTKKKIWTRNDLLTVDGELNIEIKNNNIDKVLFDNVLQPQTAKQWNFNVKPETSEKDHNLEVIFTLDGKQYTSEIIVSMQAKIDPPKPSVKQNLNDLIKSTDLGNIIDNNDKTIFSAVNQKNSNVIDDFSQIEITDKKDNQATLTAKKDSKTYQGSVVITYNVVPTTMVDLKIDLKSTAPDAIVVKDYVGQIDKTIITNPVNSFYYANSESKITMIKPTASSVITGMVYGCDQQWINSTIPPKVIDSTNGIVLDGSQLSTNNGKYIIELQDNLGNQNKIYLQINKVKTIPNYFDTDNGKQFEKWAKANGHDNIHGYSVRQLNKLFEESKSWIKQANDNQLANAVADWFKTKGNVSSKQIISKEQIVEQLKQQIPKTITIDKFDTSNYDLNKVSFEIKGMQFQPNEKVEIVIKYGLEKSNSFILQIQNNNPPNNDKKGLTVSAVIGIVVGVLSGLLLLGWLLKKFLITPFILEPIRKKKSEAFQRQTEKDIAQMKADEAEEETKRKGEK